MEEALVSVIVPVFGVEKYLKRCIDSIINQTYKNLEIFLVDDGGTDNCPKMCDEYAKQDKRIKVIHKKNGGISSARNAALNVFSGEYVTFVDSDDWVEETYVEELYKAIKINDCDLAACGDNRYDENGHLLEPSSYLCRNQKFKKEEVFDAFWNRAVLRLTAWAKLYHKSIFKTLRYPEGMNYEDAYIIVDICNNVKKGVITISSRLYNYVFKRHGSITSDISEKSFEMITARKRCVEKIDASTEAYRWACKDLLWTHISLCAMINGNHDLEEKEYKEFYVDYKKYIKFVPFKYRIKYFIFRHFKIFRKLLLKIKTKRL